MLNSYIRVARYDANLHVSTNGLGDNALDTARNRIPSSVHNRMANIHYVTDAGTINNGWRFDPSCGCAHCRSQIVLLRTVVYNDYQLRKLQLLGSNGTLASNVSPFICKQCVIGFGGRANTVCNMFIHNMFIYNFNIIYDSFYTINYCLF